MADDTSNRGFASMDDSLQEEISRKGGEASGGGNGGNGGNKSKSTGRGSNLSEEARRKGGKNSHGGGRRSS
jgi:uncharacterized protein